MVLQKLQIWCSYVSVVFTYYEVTTSHNLLPEYITSKSFCWITFVDFCETVTTGFLVEEVKKRLQCSHAYLSLNPLHCWLSFAPNCGYIMQLALVFIRCLCTIVLKALFTFLWGCSVLLVCQNCIRQKKKRSSASDNAPSVVIFCFTSILLIFCITVTCGLVV